MSDKPFDYFCTPTWAETLVIGKVSEFTDLQLSVMKVFISDEQLKRAAAERAKAEAN